MKRVVSFPDCRNEALGMERVVSFPDCKNEGLGMKRVVSFPDCRNEGLRAWEWSHSQTPGGSLSATVPLSRVGALPCTP